MLGHVAPSVVTRTQPPRCGLVGAVGWAVAAVQLFAFLVLRPAFPHNEGRRLTLPAAASHATKRIYIIRHGEKAEPADRSDYDYDHGCLSEKGWARAYNLKSIFGKGGWLHTPDALFSANYHDPLECRDANGWYRTQQTLAALAQAAPGGLGLTVGNSSGWMPQLCGAEVQPDASFARAVPGHLVSRQGLCAPYGLCGGDSWAEGRRCDDRFAGECCNRAAAESLLAKLSESGVSTVLVAWESVNTVWLTRALGVPEDQARPMRPSGVSPRVRPVRRIVRVAAESQPRGSPFP